MHGFSVCGNAVWRTLVVVAVLAGVTVGQFDICFPDSTAQVQAPNSFNFTGVDRFGLQLFRELVPPGGGNSNLIMSPYSIWSALSLAMMGSEGSTREQLQSALGLPNTKLQAFRTKYAIDFLLKLVSSGTTGGPELRRVDHAYFDSSLNVRKCVSNVIQNVEVLDFGNTAAATARINQDISRGTGGQIPDFLSPTALVNAVFVLANAIYFKGTWETKFNVKDTTRQVFYNSKGVQVAQAEMMSQMGPFNIVNSPALGANLLELPYDNSNMSMIVILPDLADPSVERVLQALNPYTLSQALSAMNKVPVKITIPKIDLKTEIESELIQALKRMGIADMFDGARANFSAFSDFKPLFADTVIHQAKVTVDEAGTTASAATVIVGTRSGPGRFVEFIANRPFIFLIYEKRVDVTLFAAVIQNPSN